MFRVLTTRNGRQLQAAMRRFQQQQQRYSSSGTPMNTVVMFVPQQQAWVVERFGKYNRILSPGLNFLIPLVDRVKYVQSLKEMAINIPEQRAITHDNVTLMMDGVLYLRVQDPYKASYGVEDPEFAITQLAQTTMRSEIGKIAMDTVFRERDSLNLLIVDAINKASEAWGVLCLRYEIKDIQLPDRVKEAMQMQVEAERKKRAAILTSEGTREADINVAEGKKQARILNSEANKMEQINQATGEAEAIIAKARAQATSVQVVAEALNEKNGMNAVSMRIAEQYVNAFGNLAKESNTVLLPTNTGDIGSMVSQAMAIYSNLADKNTGSSGKPDSIGFSSKKLDSGKTDNQPSEPKMTQTFSDTHLGSEKTKLVSSRRKNRTQSKEEKEEEDHWL